MLEAGGENVGRGQEPPNEAELLKLRLQTMHAEDVIAEFKSVQDEAQEIKDKIEGTEKNRRSVDWHGELPKDVKETKQQELNRITNIVKQTIVGIQHEEIGVRNLIADGRSRDVLVKLCEKRYPINEMVNKIDENNAIYLFDIIRRGLDGRLNSTRGLIEAFASAKNLQFLDNNLYIQISKIFQEKAQAYRARPEDMERLKTDEEREGKMKDYEEEARAAQFHELRDDLLRKSNEMSDEITRSVVEDRVKRSSRIRNKIRESCEFDHIGTQDGQEFERRLGDETLSIRGDLIYELNQLTAGEQPDYGGQNLTPEEVQQRIIKASSSNNFTTIEQINSRRDHFINHLQELRDEGVLPADIVSNLRNAANELSNKAAKLLSFRDLLAREGQPGNLYRYAANYVQNWEKGLNGKPGQPELLQVLDDPKAFLTYAEKNYNGFAHPEDWENFRKDVRGLYETIFSAAASNPKDFWERSFNELTEGMVYKMLNGALIQLGENIRNSQTYGKNSNIKVGVADYYAKKEEPAYEGSLLAGGATLTRKKIIPVDLGRAVQYLTYEMIDYKELTEYGHNVNALTELGLGFDKLQELSGRLRMEDVMRMVKSMPGLADAMQLYHENISMVTGLNNRIIPVDFGRQGADHLDSVSRQTYYQLGSLESIRKLGYAEKDILRLIRLSVGLSKGVTGGFFGAAWNNMLSADAQYQVGDPNSKEFIWETKRGEDGKEVRVKKFLDKRNFGTREDTYKSTSDRGVEKMITSIDFYLTLKRFNIPRIWDEIGGSYAPRNLKSYKPDQEDIWTNHADIIDWHKEIIRARDNGRTNKLIDKDKDHVFLIEQLRTKTIDYALREGWRYYDYRRYLVFEKNDNGSWEIDPKSNKRKIDFHKTMKRLEGVGPQVVKIFINDLFSGRQEYQKDISDLSIEDLGRHVIDEYQDRLRRVGDAGWSPDKSLNGAQSKMLKEIFYEKYIFDKIRSTRPSHFIAMEDRRWMNEDEVRGTLLNEKNEDGTYKFKPGITFHDQLTSYLLETYPKSSRSWVETNILPMYVSALQTLEKNEWSRRFEIWKEMEKTANYEGDGSLFDYDLSNETTRHAIFNNEENQKSLRNLYNLYRTSIGGTVEGAHEAALKDEEFIENLKGFYDRVNWVIDQDRWDHNQEKDSSGRWYHPPSHKKENLMQRYAKMLATPGGSSGSPMGNIDTYLTWGLMNLDEFYFETSGNRGPERMFTETAIVATKVVPMLSDLFFNKMDMFTRKTYGDIHELEKALTNNFAEDFKKISDAVGMIDQDQAWDYLGKIAMSMERMMVKDKLFRVGFVGPIVGGVMRRAGGVQASFTTTRIPETEREGATSLDSTGAEVFYQVVGNATGMHREREQVIGQEEATFLGKPITNKFLRQIWPRKPIVEHGHISIEDLIKNSDVKLWSRVKEQLPMILPVFLILMGMLLKLALDKDKKK